MSAATESFGAQHAACKPINVVSDEKVPTSRPDVPLRASDAAGVGRAPADLGDADGPVASGLPPADGSGGLGWFVFAAGCYAVLAGLVTLTGWATGAPRLTDWIANGTSMMPNTAMAAIFGGLALIGHSQRRAGLAMVAAGLAGAIGGATLIEHLLGINLGIDTMVLHREWGQSATVAPGRMGPPAAASYTLIGVSLLLATRARVGGWVRRGVATTGLVVVGVASLSLVGFLFGASSLYTLPRYTAIAVQTSTVLLMLGLGVMAAVPEVEPVLTLWSQTSAGRLARRVLPVLVLLPVLLGWARLQGQKADLFDLPFGTALRTIVEIALLAAMLWWAARAVRTREADLSRSEAALRRQSGRLAAIVESSDDAIISMGLDGVVTSWNLSAERVFGHSAEEAVGRHVTLIIPPERWPEEDVVLARMARGEKIDHFETERRTKDGGVVIVSLSVSPIRDAAGRVVGASKVARDITAQKRAEAVIRESEERMRLATEATGVGIWEWNVFTGAVHWDAQMFRIYGLPPTDGGLVAYTTWSDSVDAEDLRRQEAALAETIATRGRGSREFRIRRRDTGEFRDIQTVEAVRLNTEGRVEWVVGTNLDVTERKLAAEALAAHRNLLEQRVEERTRQIDAAYRRVAVADRMAAVGTMAAGLTHDMNNVLLPMSIRLNALTALADLPEAARGDLAAVIKLLRHLREMSRSLSLFARDPAQDGSEGRTDLSEWRTLVEEFIEISATGRSPTGTDPANAVRIAWEVPPGLRAVAVAPHRLTQAVLNLVHNARDSIIEGRRQDHAAGRETAGRGWITIAACPGEESGNAGTVTLSVIDDGCGMDAETVRRCTEPFFTTKDGPGAPGVSGTGLGMALARGIVERAGGRIEIESTAGVGTTVTLVFPQAKDESSGEDAAR